ncbi:PGF-CTERM sorting domain-containing protein [Halobacteriales archaeon QH_3_68_24]|nr:MAG: PGF-CTERM sorting domain-containing protein [Halobacteriales archaeon QH_3_68_24]
MNLQRTLAVVAAVVVLGAVAVAALAPGAVADRSDEPVRSSYLTLQEPRVAAGSVSGETVELSLDLRLDHRGGPARNVTIEVQAIDRETGLVARTVRKDLGNITGNREVRTRVNVTVPREGGYRLHTRVYENGERIETGLTEVRGVDSLTPDSLEFHRFTSGGADLPVISYSPTEADDNRTALETRTWLTNRGEEPAGGLELVVRARQVESNLIADRATVRIDEVRPGRTATPTVELDVPSNYNYYLDGILLRDGVIVGSATSGAMLDPSRPVPENTTREEVEFDAGDFTSETPEPPRDRDTPAPTVESGPGFGIAVTLLALLAAAFVAHRRRP